jgi:ribosomal protein L34
MLDVRQLGEFGFRDRIACVAGRSHSCAVLRRRRQARAYEPLGGSLIATLLDIEFDTVPVDCSPRETGFAAQRYKQLHDVVGPAPIKDRPRWQQTICDQVPVADMRGNHDETAGWAGTVN